MHFYCCLLCVYIKLCLYAEWTWFTFMLLASYCFQFSIMPCLLIPDILPYFYFGGMLYIVSSDWQCDCGLQVVVNVHVIQSVIYQNNSKQFVLIGTSFLFLKSVALLRELMQSS
jgi:hypothetical protein